MSIGRYIAFRFTSIAELIASFGIGEARHYHSFRRDSSRVNRSRCYVPYGTDPNSREAQRRRASFERTAARKLIWDGWERDDGHGGKIGARALVHPTPEQVARGWNAGMVRHAERGFVGGGGTITFSEVQDPTKW